MNTNDYLESSCTGAGYFSAAECERIIALSEKMRPLEGGIMEDSRAAPEVRQSSVFFVDRNDDTQWLFAKLDVATTEINQVFGFEIVGIREVQLACYRAGHFYDWHMDIGKGPLSMRKLSLSLQLSDPGSYEGGELEIQHGESRTAPKALGTVIVFPSYLSHRVTPVTRGNRWSLVAWVHGPPFR